MWGENSEYRIKIFDCGREFGRRLVLSSLAELEPGMEAYDTVIGKFLISQFIC
jgi:hypothetical protein